MRWAWTLAIVLISVGLAPVLGLTVGSVIAGLAGCDVNAGLSPSCHFAGADWGAAIEALGVLGWAFFLTAPLALAGFALAIALAVMSLMRHGRD